MVYYIVERDAGIKFLSNKNDEGLWLNPKGQFSKYTAYHTKSHGLH